MSGTHLLLIRENQDSNTDKDELFVDATCHWPIHFSSPS